MSPQTQMPEDLLSLAESTQTVKLNVGGAKYETTWELLSALPKIATIAYERWIEDAEAEIFIDRDGSRFAYCLDYARDGKAHLPPMISKDALKGDLEFYGVEEIDLVNLSQTSTPNVLENIDLLNKRIDALIVVKEILKKVISGELVLHTSPDHLFFDVKTEMFKISLLDSAYKTILEEEFQTYAGMELIGHEILRSPGRDRLRFKKCEVLIV